MASSGEVITLNPPPRRYSIQVEHHHDGRVSFLIFGIGNGTVTNRTLKAILTALAASIEEGENPDDG